MDSNNAFAHTKGNCQGIISKSNILIRFEKEAMSSIIKIFNYMKSLPKLLTNSNYNLFIIKNLGLRPSSPKVPKSKKPASLQLGSVVIPFGFGILFVFVIPTELK